MIPAASHYDNTQTSNFTGVGTGDYLFEDGWWFRVSGDTAESFFPAPDTTSCAGAGGTITWTNVSARGFSATNTLTLTSAAANTGELTLTMSVTNLSAVNPLTISLFHGADFDVNGTAGTDNPTLLTPNTHLRITDTTAGSADYKALNPAANTFLVRPFNATTDVFGLLGDASVTNFDNSGIAPNIDVTAAYQWDRVIPPNGNASVSVKLTGNSALATPTNDGDLDPAFWSGQASIPLGVARTAFGGATDNDGVYGIGIQSVGANGGKIVAAGLNAGAAFQTALARYNTDGTLDTAGFAAPNGKLLTSIGTGAQAVNGIAIGPGTDKIAVVGTNQGGNCPTGDSGPGNWTIFAFNADGTPDNTFNGNGKLEVDFFTCRDVANSVAIQTDGKIVVMGTAFDPGVPANPNDNIPYLVMARYLTTGLPDPTFNGGVIANTTGQVRTNVATGVLGQLSKFKLITSGPQAGKFLAYGGGSNFILARFNSDGSMDGTFGPADTGFITTPFPGGSSGANAIALYGDGTNRIVLGGDANSGTDFAAARYSIDGALDTAGFGASGLVVTDLASSQDSCKSINVMSNGKIVMTGGASFNSLPQIGIIRLTTAGVLDATFGTGGKITSHLGQNAAVDNAETVNTGAMQWDNKILVGGSVNTSFQSDSDFFVARFLNTVPTAAGVSVSGRVLTDEGRGVRGAPVTITDSNGVSKTVITSAMGRFQIDDVEPGQTYVVSIRSRRFNYSPQVVQVNDNIADLEFTPGK